MLDTSWRSYLGFSKTEKGRDENESESKFKSTGFWLAKHELTQASFKLIMGDNPSIHKKDDHPVEMINYIETKQFISKCKVQKGVLRLPTKDEWEYACRGGKGNQIAFYWGNVLDGNQANVDGMYPYGIETQGPSLFQTTPVGCYESKYPHPWGLCDMIGNVSEWCDSSNDQNNRIIRPKAYRGGNFMSYAEVCRTAVLVYAEQNDRHGFIGFRLLLED